MRLFLLISVLLCVLGSMVGCHSGTTRGIGSDLSRIGDNLQK